MSAAAPKTKTATFESPFEAAYALGCGCESNALSNCRAPSDCQKPRGKAPYDRKSFSFGHKTDTKQMSPSVPSVVKKQIPNGEQWFMREKVCLSRTKRA